MPPVNLSPVVRSHWDKLVREGNALRGLYGVPVFLTGSALKRKNDDPRDIDIRIMISDAEFARRYGNPEHWQSQGHTGRWTAVRWKWSDDCVKQSRRASAFTGLNCDVQIYPATYARHLYGHLRRVRLDSRGKAGARLCRR